MMRLLLFLALSGCVSPLSEGEWGTFRYFGEIRGEPPMRLLPPRTDRDGNVYVLFGDTEGGEDSVVYTGTAAGDWSSGCTAHRGSEGLRGFVGQSEDRAWYWSGDALVEVDGVTGSCGELLKQDPVSLTELTFEGVIPRVDETPSRRYLAALVQGSVDPLPYHVLIDLDQGTYSDATQFSPNDASDIVVLGTGAFQSAPGGAMVLAYTQSGDTVFEVLFIGRDGSPSDRFVVDLDSDLAIEGAIQGFLQSTSGGLWAGLLSDGSLLLFDENSGATKAVGNMDPIGVQAWGGDLFLTGLADGTPAIAPILSNGTLDSAVTWESPIEAQAELDKGIKVRDERHSPTRRSSWNDAQSAISSMPLLSSHPIDVYTLDSTGWLVAGPGYETGVEPYSSVAFAPVGVELP
jgi:hypothetical protein